MINIEECKKLFKNYVFEYDMDNDKINYKYYHSLRVMNFCEKISKSLNLNDNDIKISMLIGLLHDIGRFEQIRVYNTFDDENSIDHADYGVQILKENNYIEKFISDEKIQNIVLVAIKNHNKFAIEKDLDERQLMFSKIIRDADKLDIFNALIEPKKRIEHTSSSISKSIYQNLLDRHPIRSIDIKTEMDSYLGSIAMVFDLNFNYSLDYVKENKIMNNLIDKIIDNNHHEITKLSVIKENILKYIDEANRKED